MLLASFSVILASSFVPTALAQAPTDIDHTQDKILGFSPILIALGITIIGVSLRIFQGIVKRRQLGDGSGNVDPVQILSSFVISFFASLPIVGTGLHNIPHGITELNLFVMLVGMIATVMGIDAGVKAGINQARKSKSPIPPPPAPAAPMPPAAAVAQEPDTIPETLPPGKGI